MTDTPPSASVVTGAHINPPSYSMRYLFEAAKGKIAYNSGETFMLHVFWEVASRDAAREMLSGLRRCARATHRDTPCTPTYFFRISTHDSRDCVTRPAQTLGELPAWKEGQRMLQCRVPLPAVEHACRLKGLDPALLNSAASSPLPTSLRGQQPVRAEMTEVYLDERAFMEHAGSRDYLDGYAVVMNPKLNGGAGRPLTLQFGTPTNTIGHNILEVILHAEPSPLHPGCYVWRAPRHEAKTAVAPLPQPTEQDGANVVPPSSSVRLGYGLSEAAFLSLDVAADSGVGKDGALSLSSSLLIRSTSVVLFTHPLRPGSVRLMCVLRSPPTVAEWTDLFQAVGAVQRGEVHTGQAHAGALKQSVVEAARAARQPNIEHTLLVNVSELEGYPLHYQADELVVDSQNPRATDSVLQGCGNDRDRFCCIREWRSLLALLLRLSLCSAALCVIHRLDELFYDNHDYLVVASDVLATTARTDQVARLMRRCCIRC